MKTQTKNIILTPFNILYKISPVSELKLLFRLKQGYPLNTERPVTYNEKLQWLKLNDRNPLIPKCVDKYLVREYLKENGFEELLNELYWHGFDPEEIPFDELPERFVIKVTHGSTFNIIVKDKNDLDKKKTIATLRKWLKTQYIPCYGEWFYGIERPRIIVEKYLEDDTGGLRDYKVFCFHGKAKIMSVIVGRNSEPKLNFYTPDWRFVQNAHFKKYAHFETFAKPECLDGMIKKAEAVSKPFMHARVDFYIVNGKPVFGEICFINGGGFDRFKPYALDKKMGSWLKLPGGK